MAWIVVAWKTDDPTRADQHAYGAFDQSADEDAHKPFDEENARSLADSVNGMTEQSGYAAMALPLEETLQPGV